MILEELYTTPKPLFKHIVFKKGLNIIYAHSDIKNDTNSASSLHALGKSLLLDFILFALLTDIKYLHRLDTAYNKDLIGKSSINLVFTIKGIKYKITRSFSEPNTNIYFGQLNRQTYSYPLRKMQKELFRLFFFRENYYGTLPQNWYFKFITFFLKVKKREELFTDPINFSRSITDLIAIPFHLFLININNSLPAKSQEILSEISNLKSLSSTSLKLLKKNSKTKSPKELENKKRFIQNLVNKLNKQINSLSLSENYKDLGNRANELTTEIKALLLQNSVNEKRLKEIEEISKNAHKETHDWSKNVADIYNQVNSLLANNVKKTLQEANDFRKELYSSRKSFINNEMRTLKGKIFVTTEKIEQLDKERQEIYNHLSKLNAFDDLKSSYSQLNKLQNDILEIDKSLKPIKDIEAEIEVLSNNSDELDKEVEEYLTLISEEKENFEHIIKSVYDILFLGSHDVKVFNISQIDSKQKIKISVLEGSVMDSTGKNQLRTLIYDFAVLLNIIKQNLNAPHFIVHDGIFENLDKSHFYAFIKFIKDLSKNDTQFQYILTLNEHNYFNEIKDFEENEILANSIIELTPNAKLLGQDF